ncbi:hypothetical protein ACFOLL_12550 [Falsochrobactrum ovis]|uniref:Uncharacterized protein n=1 Tax=Falsochrobactrum ovis TaxID=1293442 RepID=A0A364JT81_9HYPH|nr:hypothetical protein [Falsochrobactrum ovis]RAK26389.1 hypothetical protein C7374_11475 [Falsochrobactrum ovis]
MVNWIAGWKPGVGPVMKVMKYDSDDPMTVANTAYDRFYFNSETSHLSYAWDHFQVNNLNDSTYPIGNYALSGGGLSTTKWGLSTYMRGTSSSIRRDLVYFHTRDPGLNMMPLVETRVGGADGRVEIMHNYPTWTDNSWVTSISNNAIACYVYPTTSTGFDFQRLDPAFGHEGWCVKANNGASGYSADIVGDQAFLTSMIWDLPADNTAIPKPTGTPIAGQLALAIEPSRVVMARPGFSVDGSSGRQRILDSDRSPVKCVMMGETPLISPGTSYFHPKTVDFDLETTMVCDTICSMNGWDYSIPVVDLDPSYRTTHDIARYRVEAGGIRFWVEGKYPVKVRFMLYATGIAGRTTGGSQTMRKLDNGHIQIKRPGSSDTAPGYNDILLDTRFPALTVIDEGWIPLSSFSSANIVSWRYGKVAARVNFNPSGLFIFPKVAGHFQTAIRQGQHELRVHLGGGQEVARFSMATVVRSDHIVIHLSPGNYSGPGASLPDPLGVRYYILGAATI